VFGHIDDKRVEGLKGKRRRGFGFAQARFEGMPAGFDGVEIGAVGWKEFEMTSGILDEFFGAFGLMKAGVVEDDGLSGRQARRKKIFDPCVENIGICCAFQVHGRLKLLLVVSRDDADALRMDGFGCCFDLFSTHRARVGAATFQFNSAFVDVNQARLIKFCDVATKGFPLFVASCVAIYSFFFA
jgi:hypothetical protein